MPKLKFHSLLLIATIIVMSSCGEEENPNPIIDDVIKVEQDSAFVSESILLEPNTFPSNFNESIWNCLEEAGICTGDSANFQKTFCSSDWFRVFPLGKNLDFSAGLICESRSLQFNGGSTKNVLVITKEKGQKALKVDHFLGKLIELKTNANGYYDMIMSYRDSQIGTVSVLHRFEDGYYKPVEVTELNYYFVKEEAKDSLFNVYLKDFRWGY